MYSEWAEYRVNNKSCPNIVTLNVDLFQTKEREKKSGLLIIDKKGKLDRFAPLFVIVSMFNVSCCLVKLIQWIFGCINLRKKNKTFSLFVLLSIERRSNYMFSNIVYWFKFSHATLAFAIHNGILFVSSVNHIIIQYKFWKELLIAYRISFE